jgi:hypothetical protein
MAANVYFELTRLFNAGFLPRARAAVHKALTDGDRDALVVALARETDELRDRARLDRLPLGLEPE